MVTDYPYTFSEVDYAEITSEEQLATNDCAEIFLDEQFRSNEND